MDDLELNLAEIIQNNSQAVAKMSSEIKETQKEFVSYKKQIDTAQLQKDMKFENEVRACLNEQLTYVSELQTEMFKQCENLRNSVKDLSWQLAKEEDSPDLKRRQNIKQTEEIILDFVKLQNSFNER